MYFYVGLLCFMLLLSLRPDCVGCRSKFDVEIITGIFSTWYLLCNKVIIAKSMLNMLVISESVCNCARKDAASVVTHKTSHGCAQLTLFLFLQPCVQ